MVKCILKFDLWSFIRVHYRIHGTCTLWADFCLYLLEWIPAHDHSEEYGIARTFVPGQRAPLFVKGDGIFKYEMGTFFTQVKFPWVRITAAAELFLGDDWVDPLYVATSLDTMPSIAKL